MCGIFAYLAQKSQKLIDKDFIDKLKLESNKIQYRGPDNTRDLLIDDTLYLSFHRLAINGLESESDEPLTYKNMILICNGEIYNYPQLQEKYQFNLQTHNDCEIIIHLFLRFGFRKTLEMLDGVFSIILFDIDHNQLFIANDPIGIRPLYFGQTVEGDLVWASEPVSLVDLCQQIEHFQPGCYRTYTKVFDHYEDSGYQRYFKYEWTFNNDDLPTIYSKYRELLTNAVEKRLLGERPFACLLSGGLDSSLISSLTARIMKERRLGRLNTFSIGLEGSPDLEYAEKVAHAIGSIHHSVVVKEEDMLDAIPEVINAIQSYDVTTVRASCGNYLIAKYISENTDFKIILNGDVSEEIHASYYYSRFAPSSEEFYQDNVRLLKEVHKYDVLRSARCIEHFGMEARTPFADKDLVNYVMTIPPKYKECGSDKFFPMEKMLMRMAFYDGTLIGEVCWRPKVAFSDGVSQKQLSWHDIIKRHMDKVLSTSDYKKYKEDYKILFGKKHGPGYPKIYSKEACYYRMIFDQVMGGKRLDCLKLIGEYWMPRFIEAKDPSARVLGSN